MLFSLADEVDAFPEVQQIDLAPTLSLLVGIPIPMNSLGGVITELVEDLLPPREILRAMQVNSHQLASVLHKNVANVRNGRILHKLQVANKNCRHGSDPV